MSVRMLGLAVRLAVVTRSAVSWTRRSGGGYRLVARLPAGLDGDEQLKVLAVLTRADRFGHRCRPEGQAIWAELDARVRKPRPERRD